jgi:ArsR family transcriptional regulator
MTIREGAAMTEQQFQRVAKALADGRRFAIYERIASAPELACQRMSECFPVSQATVSHHLKELAGAGLVESRREGQYVFYRALPEALDAYLAELRRRIPVAAKAAGGAKGGESRTRVARQHAST